MSAMSQTEIYAGAWIDGQAGSGVTKVTDIDCHASMSIGRTWPETGRTRPPPIGFEQPASAGRVALDCRQHEVRRVCDGVNMEAAAICRIPARHLRSHTLV